MVWYWTPFGIRTFSLAWGATRRLLFFPELNGCLPSARGNLIAFLVTDTGLELSGVMLSRVGVFTSVMILIWFAFFVGVRCLPGTVLLPGEPFLYLLSMEFGLIYN